MGEDKSTQVFVSETDPKEFQRIVEVLLVSGHTLIPGTIYVSRILNEKVGNISFYAHAFFHRPSSIFNTGFPQVHNMPLHNMPLGVTVPATQVIAQETG